MKPRGGRSIPTGARNLNLFPFESVKESAKSTVTPYPRTIILKDLQDQRQCLLQAPKRQQLKATQGRSMSTDCHRFERESCDCMRRQLNSESHQQHSHASTF